MAASAKKPSLILLAKGLKNYFLQIKDAVKSVNGVEAGEDGDIKLNSVPFAQGLESDASQRSTGTFIVRMAGGEASVNSGDAWLLSLLGNCIHEGYVPEALTMEVTAIERANPITATIDPDTFKEYVTESGTITLAYSTDWTTDPTLYGITVTGTPVSGDVITIDYTKEERGEIFVANPASLIATGWNLYDNTAGYARVAKYAHGYRVGGTFTSLQYSATLTGSKSELVVTSGNFDIPDDGYVWVNGGSNDTEIYATWDDWTEGPSGQHENYTQTEIDLSAVMDSIFPYGLLRVGSAADEIDLNLGQAISRIEQMDYSEANRAIAAASGRDYIFDEDNIYLVRAAAQISSIEIDGSFTTNDHGIEYFTQTDTPVEAQILYGNNLKNKLERDVLTISPQTLTPAQKEQARNNIGAAAPLDVVDASSAITWGYAAGSEPTGALFAYGKVRMLRIGFTPSNTNSGWSTILTLPEGHRPASYFYTPIMNGKNIRLTTAGVLEIYNRAVEQYLATITYIAQ